MSSAENVARKTTSYAPAFAGVREMLAQGVEDQVFPGAVLLVGKQGEVVFFESVGQKYVPEYAPINHADPRPTSAMTVDTVFDIASLTQPIITASLIMTLVEQGKIKLDERVTRYIPGFGVFGKSEIKIRHLLEHSSGLIHWHPFFEDLIDLNSSSRLGILASRTAKDYVYNAVHKLNAKHKPSTRQIFSDIGYIILGELIETLTGYPLEKAAQRFLIQPLKMRNTSFIDLSLIKRGTLSTVPDLVAPTEFCPWRKRVICAEVHDDNAWAMGGISGHGGCFSTAEDLHMYACHLLAAYFGESSFASRRTVREFLYPWTSLDADEVQFEHDVRGMRDQDRYRWRYGWEGACDDNGMDQAHFSPFAVGHSGFTGCSLWLEPESGVDIILLSNRIHPTRNNKLMKTYRPLLHEAVIEALTSVG